MSAISNLNFIERNIGSKIKSTKKQYIWEFTIDNLNHKIEYFDSVISKKRKVIVDGKLFFTTDDGYKDSFFLNFQLKGHNITINRTFNRVDLRIDSESFEHAYYIEKNKLFYNNNPEPTVYTTVGKIIEKNNDFSLKDYFYSNQINRSENTNQKQLFNFKINNQEKKHHNFSKFKFGGDDKSFQNNSFQNNSFQNVNNSFQKNNQKDNKLNQSTQQSQNLLDLDFPNDENLKNNNVIFHQSNNDLLNDIFGENNQGQKYVNVQNQFNNNNYNYSINNINNNIQNINQLNNNNNMFLQNQQIINQYTLNQNKMNTQNQQLSENKFQNNNSFNLNTQFQNSNLSNENNNIQNNLNNNYNYNQLSNNNSYINQINNNMNYNMNNQFNNNQFQNNNFNIYQINNNEINQYNIINNNQISNNLN